MGKRERRGGESQIFLCALDTIMQCISSCFKACLHCGKMNQGLIRILFGSVVSRWDVVRLRPHCNNG